MYLIQVTLGIVAGIAFLGLVVLTCINHFMMEEKLNKIMVVLFVIDIVAFISAWIVKTCDTIALYQEIASIIK